jgi:hypothetical protein
VKGWHVAQHRLQLSQLAGEGWLQQPLKRSAPGSQGGVNTSSS